jgi:hypothetical protein
MKLNQLKCDNCGKVYEPYLEHLNGSASELTLDKKKYWITYSVVPEVWYGSAQGDNLHTEKQDFCPKCNERLIRLIINSKCIQW